MTKEQFSKLPLRDREAYVKMNIKEEDVIKSQKPQLILNDSIIAEMLGVKEDSIRMHRTRGNFSYSKPESLILFLSSLILQKHGK